MRSRLILVAVIAAVAVGAAHARALLEEPRPEESTLAQSTFIVTATFRGLDSTRVYDFTWTAHFDEYYEDGTQAIYVLGGSVGVKPRNGVLAIFTDVADFAYFQPYTPIEWVRVCLRPAWSAPRTELTGTDGKPICKNIETGGYRASEPPDHYDPTLVAYKVTSGGGLVRITPRPADAPAAPRPNKRGGPA